MNLELIKFYGYKKHWRNTYFVPIVKLPPLCVKPITTEFQPFFSFFTCVLEDRERILQWWFHRCHAVYPSPDFPIIRDHKFSSTFETVVLGSLKSFFRSYHQGDISFYLKEVIALHSKSIVTHLLGSQTLNQFISFQLIREHWFWVRGFKIGLECPHKLFLVVCIN